jgi:hypothetical protein
MVDDTSSSSMARDSERFKILRLQSKPARAAYAPSDLASERI